MYPYISFRYILQHIIAEPQGLDNILFAMIIFMLLRKADQCICASLQRMYGAVAQLGERLNGIQEADGSIPFSSTIDTSKAAHNALPFFIPALFLYLQY
jgi:hypothetical protein